MDIMGEFRRGEALGTGAVKSSGAMGDPRLRSEGGAQTRINHGFPGRKDSE